MNRAEILARIGRALNKADTLDARTKARLLDVLNTTHRQILSAPGCAGLRRREIAFTAIAGQSRYAIPNTETIKHIRDLTNDRELAQRSLGVYRELNPDPSSHQGTPDGFVPIGYQPVAQQPPLAGAPIFVTAFDALDNTQTIYVEGGLSRRSVTLNGLIPVQIGNFPWTWIEKFYASAPLLTNAVLTHTTATGPELGRIFSGYTSNQYLSFYLDPTPSAALPYVVDAEFFITDLAQDTDEPMIPSDFHDLVETGALVAELAHLDDNRLVVLQRQYDKRLGELKLKLARQGMDTGPRGTTSRYGPWAPSTPW